MPKLLSTANPKIQKGTKLGYLSFILHLAPADLSGKETCPKRTAGCTAACLNTAGRGGMFKRGENTNMIQKARIRKTQYFFNARQDFMLDLKRDIEKAVKMAGKLGLIPVFRIAPCWMSVRSWPGRQTCTLKAQINIVAGFTLPCSLAPCSTVSPPIKHCSHTALRLMGKVVR